MELYWEDSLIRLYHGDARFLDAIPDESVDLIFTSPPYWGKRSYGDETVAVWGGEKDCPHDWSDETLWIRDRRMRGSAHGRTAQCGHTLADVTPTIINQGSYCSLCGAWRGSLGLEPDWRLYIDHLCECAREWWRVLKPTGNLFINIGDTFISNPGNRAKVGGFQGGASQERIDAESPMSLNKHIAGIPKMKLGIPYRLRFALNDMGWVSRGDWVWYKGKEYPDGHISKVAMPESAKDRMSASYEMVFHFVKSKGNRCERYWFDLDAIRQPHKAESIARYERGVNLVERTGAAMTPDNKFWDKDDLDRYGGAGTLRGRSYRDKTLQEKQFKPEGTLRQAPEPGEPHAFHPGGANPGDVWIIQPEPFKFKHYAVWPSELCERVIKVGCPKEVCPKCGKPRERITRYLEKPKNTGEQRMKDLHKELAEQGQVGRMGGTTSYKPGGSVYPTPKETIGWSDCGCGEGFVPGVTLDPFCGGSARAPRMARKLGRRFIGVDLKEDYLEMSRECYLQGEVKEIQKQQELGFQQEVLL